MLSVNWKKRNLMSFMFSYRVGNFDPAAIKKNIPNIHIMRVQLSAKVNFLQSERKSHLKNRNRFEEKTEMVIGKEGILVNGNIDKVLEKVNNEIDSSGFDENSPKYLLWEQQKKMNKLKKASSLKWHPVMIRWCFSVYLKSPGKICHLYDLVFTDHDIY